MGGSPQFAVFSHFWQRLSYSTLISIVFCLNIFLSKYPFEIIILHCFFIAFFFEVFSICFWTLNVSWTASYGITLVCLSLCGSVCLSVFPSLSFLKIGSVVFSDIVHVDSWPWHLVTDRARFLKKNWQPEFGPNWRKSGPKLGFFLFFKFGSLVYLEIAYNDSLQQCLTSINP